MTPLARYIIALLLALAGLAAITAGTATNDTNLFIAAAICAGGAMGIIPWRD